VFTTLVEEFKIINGGVLQSKEVMIPMNINKRSPLLLFIGGGAGAGKSTVLKDILKE
jgi:ABC-type ATPase involved in cell division